MLISLFAHHALRITHHLLSKRNQNYWTWLLVTTIICSLNTAHLHASTIKTITPRLTIREKYDDNVDLSSKNKDQDWITTVLPGILFNLRGERTDLDLDVQGGWDWYLDDSSRDSREYRGTVRWNQQLTEFLSFNLNDTFAQTDDPITVYDGAVVDVRGGQRTQYRNNGQAGFSYVFGPDDRISAGYRNMYIDDRYEYNDDRVSHVGYANLDKWFGERFGIGLNLSHTNGNFEARDDFRQWNTGVTTYYRWNPYHFAYARYTLLDHNYDQDAFYYLGDDYRLHIGSKDYQVHEGLVGVNLTLSEYTSLYLDAGYFAQKYRSDISDDQEGLAFNLSFSTRGERITWSLDASGGYDEDYFSSDDFGSSRYAKGLARVNYRFTETISLFATVDYRWDDFYEEDVKEDRMRATAGLRYKFWQWYTASLQYTYNERASDRSSRDYTNNRIHFQLRWAYPYQF